MRFALIALAAGGLAGCQSMSSDAQRATANLQPTKGARLACAVIERR